jgi:hypothetical protein
MEEAFEAGQGPHRAVEPRMMMIIPDMKISKVGWFVIALFFITIVILTAGLKVK